MVIKKASAFTAAFAAAAIYNGADVSSAAQPLPSKASPSVTKVHQTAASKVSRMAGVIGSQQTLAAFDHALLNALPVVAGRDFVLLSEKDLPKRPWPRDPKEMQAYTKALDHPFKAAGHSLLSATAGSAENDKKLISFFYSSDPVSAGGEKAFIFVPTRYENFERKIANLPPEASPLLESLRIDPRGLVALHEAEHLQEKQKSLSPHAKEILADNTAYNNAQFVGISQETVDRFRKLRLLGVLNTNVGNQFDHLTGGWYGVTAEQITPEALEKFETDAKRLEAVYKEKPTLRAAFFDGVVCGTDHSPEAMYARAEMHENMRLARYLPASLSNVKRVISAQFTQLAIKPSAHPLNHASVLGNMAVLAYEAGEFRKSAAPETHLGRNIDGAIKVVQRDLPGGASAFRAILDYTRSGNPDAHKLPSPKK